jgi:hypothetical protein
LIGQWLRHELAAKITIPRIRHCGILDDRRLINPKLTRVRDSSSRDHEKRIGENLHERERFRAGRENARGHIEHYWKLPCPMLNEPIPLVFGKLYPLLPTMGDTAAPSELENAFPAAFNTALVCEFRETITERIATPMIAVAMVTTPLHNSSILRHL